MDKMLTIQDWAKVIKVIISKNKTEAFLEISKEINETEVPITMLMGLLERAKILYGIDLPRLHTISTNLSQLKGETIQVAKGKEPEHGIDGYIEILIKDNSKERKPIILKDGRADFFSIIDIPIVKSGQEIAKKHIPIMGKPGKTVYNTDIMPRMPRDPKIYLGKGVEENNNIVKAIIDGQLSVTDRGKINVFSVYEINGDIDFSTGNIDFIGNVIINGNINSGFKVKAGGDIIVMGGIENAEVIANGNIEIRCGIVNGRVTAGQNIKSTFITNANIYADNDIIVTDSIMHSNLSAGNNIISNGQRSLIVGGICRATNSIEAKNIGNKLNTPTNIQIGVTPELRNEYITVTNKIAEYHSSLVKTDQAMAVLSKLKNANQLTPDKADLFIKLHSSKASMEEYNEWGTNRLKELEEIFSNVNTSKVRVADNIYGGVTLIIGQKQMDIKNHMKANVFFLNEDKEITYMPL